MGALSVLLPKPAPPSGNPGEADFPLLDVLPRRVVACIVQSAPVRDELLAASP